MFRGWFTPAEVGRAIQLALACILLVSSTPGSAVASDDGATGSLSIRLREINAPAERRKEPVAIPLPDNEVDELLSGLPPLPVAPPKSAFPISEHAVRTDRVIHLREIKPIVSHPQRTIRPKPKSVTEPRLRVPRQEVRSVDFDAYHRKDSIQIYFTEPMVGPQILHKILPSDKVPAWINTVDAGHWSWTTTSSLEYKLVGNDWTPGTEISLTIRPGVGATSGNSTTTRSTQYFKNYIYAQLLPTGNKKLSKVFCLTTGIPISKPELLSGLEFATDKYHFGKRVSVSARAATPEEIATCPEIVEAIANKGADRCIAFVPFEPLPEQDSIHLLVNDRRISPTEFWLVNSQQSCSERLRYIPGLTEQFIEPNGAAPLHFVGCPDQTQPDGAISVEPPVEHLKVSGYSGYYYLPPSGILVQGDFKPRTNYKITIGANSRDQLGRSLGTQHVVHLKTLPQKPYLRLRGGTIATIDPKGPQIIPVDTRNIGRVRIRIYAAEPSDWYIFRNFVPLNLSLIPTNPQSEDAEKNQHYLPSRAPLAEYFIDTNHEWDKPIRTNIDLSPYVANGVTQFIVAADSLFNPREFQDAVWVQSTDLGVRVLSDDQSSRVFAFSLATGRPVAGASIKFGGETKVTDSNGLVETSWSNFSERSSLLIAQSLGRTALLPITAFGASCITCPSDLAIDIRVPTLSPAISSSQHVSEVLLNSSPKASKLRWFVFRDRDLYRPGDIAHVKGWIRLDRYGPKGDLELPPETAVRCTVNDPQGQKMFEHMLEVSNLGCFDEEIPIPESKVGRYTVTVELPPQPAFNFIYGPHQLTFDVEEFRRPEFVVSSKVEHNEPLIIGDKATASAFARYYSGGALTNARIDWTVDASMGYYAPPNWSDYSFEPAVTNEPSKEILRTVLSGKGENAVEMWFPSTSETAPFTVKTTATITDKNGQEWNESQTMLLHPSELYIGIKRGNSGTNNERIELIVTDIGGNPVEGVPIAVEYKSEDDDIGLHAESIRRVHQRTISSRNPVAVEFETAGDYYYCITARIKDSQGRSNSARADFLSDSNRPSASEPSESSRPFRVSTDKEEYAPGETARISFGSQAGNTSGILVIDRSGIFDVRNIEIKPEQTSITLPITDAMVPNCTIRIYLYKPNGGDVDASSLSAHTSVNVRPTTRRIELTATPLQKIVKPGEDAVIECSLRDSYGKSISGEVALAVVDESILALTNFKQDDPVRRMYMQRADAVIETNMLGSIFRLSALPTGDAPEWKSIPFASCNRYQGGITLLAAGVNVNQHSYSGSSARGGSLRLIDTSNTFNDSTLFRTGGSLQILGPVLAAGGGGGGATSVRDPRPVLRTNFCPTAVFAARVKLNETGTATVRFKLPDNITSYRIMAVASSGARLFGSTESSMIARLPLVVRSMPPRFLTTGDTCTVPVILQNDEDKTMKARIAARAQDATVDGARGYAVTIPPHDRAKVNFQLGADYPDDATVQFVTHAGSESDASQIAVPIHAPTRTETYAAYGEVDKGSIKQNVELPKKLDPNRGGMVVETSGSGLSRLQDAIAYLHRYSFECTEQLSSRILGLLTLKKYGHLFNQRNLPTGAALDTEIKECVNQMVTRQGLSGGFILWPSDGIEKPVHAFASIHALHALLKAKEAGFTIPQYVLDSGRVYLGKFLWKSVKIDKDDDYIERYRKEQSTNSTTRSYAVYVLSLFGTPPADIRELAHHGMSKLSPEGAAFLMLATPSDEQTTSWKNRLTREMSETHSEAHVGCHYDSSFYEIFYCNHRTDALALRALIKHDPSNPLTTKLMRGLVNSMTSGHWGTTQADAFALLAIADYYDKYESNSSDLGADVSINDQVVGRQLAQNKDGKLGTSESQMPMTGVLALRQPLSVVLSKFGTGRLYYRVGVEYAPAGLTQPQTEHGFSVRREYIPIESQDDVALDDKGIWHIKKDAVVQVRVYLSTDAPRHHVAVSNPIPAGLEIINSKLKGTRPLDNTNAWEEMRFDYKAYRDASADVFATTLHAHKYHYSFFAKATTAGVFTAAPALAEEMYNPETFGRSSTDKVVVE
jgi:alpha-2-macroglobulin